MNEYKFYWPVELLSVMVQEYNKIFDPLQIAVYRLLKLNSANELPEKLPDAMSDETKKKLYEKLGKYICVSGDVIENVISKLQREKWVDEKVKITVNGTQMFSQQQDTLYRPEGKEYHMFLNLLDNTIFQWSGDIQKYPYFKPTKKENKNANSANRNKGILKGLPDVFKKSLKNNWMNVSCQQITYRDPGLPDREKEQKNPNPTVKCEIISGRKGYLECLLKQNQDGEIVLDFPLTGVNLRQCVQSLSSAFRDTGERPYTLLGCDEKPLNDELKNAFEKLTTPTSNLIRQKYRQGIATEFEKWIFQNGFTPVWDLQEKIIGFDPADPFNLRTIFNKTRNNLRSDIWASLESSLGMLLNAYISKANVRKIQQEFETRTEFSANNKQELIKLFKSMGNKFNLWDGNNVFAKENERLQGKFYDAVKNSLYDCLVPGKRGEFRWGKSNKPRILFLTVDAYFNYAKTPFGQLLDTSSEMKGVRNVEFLACVDEIGDKRNNANAAHTKGAKFDDVKQEDFKKVFEQYKKAVNLLLKFMSKEWRKN